MTLSEETPSQSTPQDTARQIQTALENGARMILEGKTLGDGTHLIPADQALAAWNTRSGAVVEAQGWREMESAPKDGTPFFASHEFWRQAGIVCFRSGIGYCHYANGTKVDHPHLLWNWCPLNFPTPPTDTEDEG